MTRRIELVPAALAIVAVAAWIVLACARAPYPYELEWQEGGMLEHARRVAAGEALYARPTLAFAAFPYPPLFHWLGAGSIALFGESLLALRTIAIASTCVALALLFAIATRAANDRRAGLFAAGLFAATYRFAGAWFDVARVDMPSLALVLAAVWTLQRRASVVSAVVAGALFFLAFLAKQTALVPAAACSLMLVSKRRREGLVLGAVVGALVLASTWAFDRASDGWYRWYVFDLLAGHAWERPAVLGFWRETLVAFAPAIVVVAWSKFRALIARAEGEEDRPDLVVAPAIAGLWLAAWIGRAHAGGYDNTLIPACAGASISFGVALARTMRREPQALLRCIAAVVGTVQLALFAYDPRAQLPTAADRAAGDRLVERMRAVDGPVWVPDHGYLARRAHKESSIHGMALIDLLRGADHATAQAFVDELGRALDERRFAAIVLDRRWDDDLPALARAYRATPIEYEGERTFVPVTGDPRRPSYWYAPR